MPRIQIPLHDALMIQTIMKIHHLLKVVIWWVHSSNSGQKIRRNFMNGPVHETYGVRRSIGIREWRLAIQRTNGNQNDCPMHHQCIGWDSRIFKREGNWGPLWIRLSGRINRWWIVKIGHHHTKDEGVMSASTFIQPLIRKCIQLLGMRRVEDHTIWLPTASKSNTLHTSGLDSAMPWWWWLP